MNTNSRKDKNVLVLANTDRMTKYANQLQI